MLTPDFQNRYRFLKNKSMGKPPDREWRRAQLLALKKLIEENDDAISDALWADLRKNKTECATSEQSIVLAEIHIALENLADWMKPKKVSTALYNFPGSSEIVSEPYGLCLIIGAWNYPINLLLAPLVGALAAGNRAILKPSEMAAKTADLVGKLIPQYFAEDIVSVFQGGAEETGFLLDLQFDFIFFTGSIPVGKIVMSKASQHLTPCVLELGGKSPAIVLDDAKIDVTARRIAWGKFINAGQTCIAPDYILIQPSVRERFITALQKSLRDFFGSDPEQSPNYGRIVNARNFDRIMSLTSDSKTISGGKSNRETLFIEPTLLESSTSSAVMKDEIFGPLLPIVEMKNLDEMITFIHSRPKPLALYVFSESKTLQNQVLEQTSSGGLCINDNVMHMPQSSLPFGGVGASGMGHYHGRFSFEAFSHAKGVLNRSTWIDFPLRYPPYSNFKRKLLRWLLERF